MLDLKFAPLLRTSSTRSNTIQIIKEPTLVHSLPVLSRLWNNNIAVKREDKTSGRYGGNKVRNLEFLLGDAIAKQKSEVIAIAPLGSNFIAALSSQCASIGLPLRVFHFTTPARSQLISSQAAFSKVQPGTQLITHDSPGIRSLLAASIKFAVAQSISTASYVMPVGGSSKLGALGHVNAAFEFASQVAAGEAREPDLIYVGAGTCGTYAGLMVGF